ncbi:MAG: hypothetical protein ACLPYS_05460 [Vulcanimicrobiaceae bacterium]
MDETDSFSLGNAAKAVSVATTFAKRGSAGRGKMTAAQDATAEIAREAPSVE